MSYHLGTQQNKSLELTCYPAGFYHFFPSWKILGLSIVILKIRKQLIYAVMHKIQPDEFSSKLFVFPASKGHLLYNEKNHLFD